MRTAATLVTVFVVAVTVAADEVASSGAAGDTSRKPARDWPNWRGPTFSGAAIDCGDELVEDLNQAKLVWESEDCIPGTVGPKGWLRGGYASPSVSDGRVYLGYFAAGGLTNYDVSARDADPRGEFQVKQGIYGADDVIHCFDAASGRTLWRTAFAGKGVNYYGIKTASHMVPLIYDRRVYVLGTSGRVYAVDAESGEPLWERIVGRRIHEQFEEIKRRRSFYFKLWWHSIASCLSGTDGVVAVNDIEGGLLGFDAVSGKELWRVAGACNWWAEYPLPWRSGGVGYFLSSGVTTKDGVPKLHCIEAKTGRVAWTHDPGFDYIIGHPALYGDYMLGGTRDNKEVATLRCVKLDPREPKKVWEIGQLKSCAWTSVAAANGYVYFPGLTEQLCVEIETGKIAGRIPMGGALVSSQVHTDGRMIVPRGDQEMNIAMYKADPADLRELGKPLKTPDYGNSSSPTVADGMMYFRKAKRMVCYDLRKTPRPMAATKQAVPAESDGVGAVKQLSSPFSSDRDRAVSSLASLDRAKRKEAVPMLAEIVRTGGWTAKESAVKALLGMGDTAKPAVPALVEALRTEIGRRRVSSAGLLATTLRGAGPGSAVPVTTDLGALLASTDAADVSFACVILELLGPDAQSVVPSLARLVGAANLDLALDGMRTLREIGPGAKDAVPALITALSHKDPRVAKSAASVLGAIGPDAKGAHAALRTCLRSTDAGICNAAAAALLGIEKNLGAGLRKEVLATLNGSIKGVQDMDAAAEAVSMVGELGLKTSDPTVRDELLTMLMDALQRKGQTSLQWKAAEYLGQFGKDAAEAVPVLRGLIDNPDLSDVATEALERIQPGKPVKSGPELQEVPDLGL